MVAVGQVAAEAEVGRGKEAADKVRSAEEEAANKLQDAEDKAAEILRQAEEKASAEARLRQKLEERLKSVQEELAAARAYIYDATATMWRRLCEGHTPTLEERAHFRVAGVHAFKTGQRIVADMYQSGGGAALYRKSPLDRYFRDSATISQHAFANENAFGEVGRAFMGLDPKSALL